MRNKNLGFTLIELLIVIGVLGILAAGLLAAVDPFEQLKKGRDTNVRNVVVELHNAMIRYYASHGELPWCAGADPCTLAGSPVPLADMNGGPVNNAMDNVVADGELKGADGDDFIGNVGTGNAAKIFFNSAVGTSLTICFAPESKSLYLDSGTKFTDNEGNIANTTCTVSADGGTKTTAAPGVGQCYWCAK